LGDFSKSISLLIVQKLDGSEYPPWVTRDGVPSGSRSPAWLFCSVQCPCDTPCGSAPLSEGGLSLSDSSPTLAWSLHRPTSSPSRAVPHSPNTVQGDCICYARAGNTAGGWAGPSGRQTAPGGAETACASHYFLDRYPLCSAAGEWPPPGPPPPSPTRRRGHQRCNRWSCKSSQRGCAAAPWLRPQSPREYLARASPGHDHTREAAPGAVPKRPGGVTSDTQAFEAGRGRGLLVFFSICANMASVSAIFFCGWALRTLRTRKPIRLSPSAMVLGAGHGSAL